MRFLKDLWRALEPRLAAILTGIIDAAYLILWVIVQWITSMALAEFALTGWIDLIILRVFQAVFAGGTLYAVLAYIYRDMRIIWIRINADIDEEKRDARKRVRGDEEFAKVASIRDLLAVDEESVSTRSKGRR